MGFEQYQLISTFQDNTLLQVTDSKQFTVIPGVLMDASQFMMGLHLD